MDIKMKMPARRARHKAAVVGGLAGVSKLFFGVVFDIAGL